ncbi:mitochondrial lysine-tRNA synthetase [Ciborinia camelliae]|nr:mitochondrial lysine-tRNA synthetase [Ciborinia camelliae]
MSSLTGLRFLRPYLYHDILPVKPAAYARLFSTHYCLRDKRSKAPSCETEVGHITSRTKSSKEREERAKGQDHSGSRIEKLQNAGALHYPRIKKSGKIVSVKSCLETCAALPCGDSHEANLLTLHEAESGLISKSPVHTPIPFENISKLMQRGDIISATGYPIHKANGSATLKLIQLPQILTPGLAPVPKVLEDPETRIRNRHLDLLVNNNVAATLRLRAKITQHIRDFLVKDDFLEFQTPILADKASGAMAQPFKTNATEFPEKELTLRIAPELWLKRLVIGGLDRVFEIGPAFRNEGLDATHNPEFTTCEFYKAYADLEDLISMTEELISGLVHLVDNLRDEFQPVRYMPFTELPRFDESIYARPFKRIEFIPAIETALGERLPDLQKENAREEVLSLFTKHTLEVPENPTLPRLLDELASLYIEPHCSSPTFIMHHPSCMAPLSKSFLDAHTQQLVSARVELFIQHQEIANMYEEENSPFDQRRKLEEQLRFKDVENPVTKVDEGYVQALEVGLPPTGGWGCGVDRLVMWLGGAKRISDVLPFGNLRNVVNLGAVDRKVEGEGEGED